MRCTVLTIVGIGSATGVIEEKSSGPVALPNHFRRVTNPAVNLGGATLRLARWFGITADYRHFLVRTKKVQHVNRFLVGVSVAAGCWRISPSMARV